MRKLLIYPFIFIFLISIVYSAIPAPTHNWTFDGTFAFNDTGSSPLTATPSTKTSIISSNCVKGKCAAFSDGTVQLSGAFADVTADFTVSCFVNFNVSNDMLVYIETENAGTKGFGWYHQATTNKECAFAPGVASSCTSAANPLNAWQMVTIAYDQDNAGDRYQIYFNKTLQADSGNQVLVSDTYTKVYLSDGGLFPWEVNGYLDECLVWNAQLTAAEVNETYDSIFAEEPAVTPTITLSTNIVNYGNYSSIPLVIYFNGTAQYTSDAGYNCTISENLAAYAYNSTRINVNLSQNQNFTINTSDTTTFDGSGLWTANVSCSNINATGSFKRDNLFIDTLSPSITLLSMANNTVLYRHIDPTINATVKATDLNLYAMNVTIYKINSSGGRDIKLFSQFNDALGTTYTIQYLNNYTDNTTITNGKYEIEQMAWDSHTDNVVRNMSLYYQDNLIQIDDIKFESTSLKTYNNKNELISYFYLTTDRYKVKLTFNQNSLIHKINLSTTGKLSYIPTSQYKGHFVYFPYHWIDFMGSNVNYVESKYITDNKYEITIHLKVASDEVELESIGDLNTVKQSSYFNITDGFTFYAKEHYSQGVISAFNVFVYNGSTLIQNKSTTTGNLTFNITSGKYYTNITATGYTTNSSGNLTFSTNGSFTYDLFLTNSLLLFYYDEDTFLPLTGTNVTIDIINLDNASSTNSSTYGYAFVSGFAPGRYELQFKAPGYMPNSYFVTIDTGTTQQIKLYLVSNQTGAYIIFNLADEKGNPIKNATLIRKRFDLTQNAYVTTGMAKSDANGETSMNLVPYNVYYRFVVQAGEIILFSGTEQKVLAGTVYFRVPILKDILTSYALRYNGDLVTSPIDWNNATNIVSFTWTDTSGKVLSGCLRVLERTPMTDTTKGTSCASSSSGTVTVNMSGQTNNKSLYIAQGYIDTNSTYTEVVVETLFRSFSVDYAIGGLFGLFMAYILILTMWFLGIRISFSIASLFAVLSVIMINLSGLSFFGYGLIVFFGFMGIMIGIIIKN